MAIFSKHGHFLPESDVRSRRYLFGVTSPSIVAGMHSETIIHGAECPSE